VADVTQVLDEPEADAARLSSSDLDANWKGMTKQQLQDISKKI